MTNPRIWGEPPYRVAVVHGGPGAAGEMESVARELARNGGVLEPMQTATTVEGQVRELAALLERHAAAPVALVGFSWGAWLRLMVAARHAALVRKLVLVGSGPFEERYVARIERARMARLSEPERLEFAALVAALADGAAPNKDAALARLGALASKTDAFDPLPEKLEEPEEPDDAPLRGGSGDLFQRVWTGAAEMRHTGELMTLARRVRCPVVAIHGDHDPHPADGVREPLSLALPEFRFVLLERCGHKPWAEQHARAPFLAALRSALA